MTVKVGQLYDGSEGTRIDPVEVDGTLFEVTANLYEDRYVVVQSVEPDTFMEVVAIKKLGYRFNGCEDGLCTWQIEREELPDE